MIRYSSFYLFLLCCLFTQISFAQETVFPGADEQTPSKAQYFSWINNTNEGATEEQSLTNLAFFEWLKDEYGMQLDIYAFDAGAIDGKNFYGSVHSKRFQKQFPNGFDPIYKKAKKMNTRLGIWGGPDGFGDDPKSEKRRMDQMVALCKDYEFALFKFDAVCGPLRPEKEGVFIEMMKSCRQYSPDLILLNHRLGLNQAKPYATTFLWEGYETYIDVWMTNKVTAPHHRAGALSRGLVPDLKRLTEDHGVCISSCLDYWEDDLILQAFNRNLILAPEIYGNPWLLRDEEYPMLARIFNLHRKYRAIMVNGKVLPESYGPYAVSRGDDQQRLITLRNLEWEEQSYTIDLDETIGLAKGAKVEVRQVHPTEKVIGLFDYGQKVSIPVAPFRSSLIYVGTQKSDEPAIVGSDYRVLKNKVNETIEMEILGMPGSQTSITLADAKQYRSIEIEGKSHPELLAGKSLNLQFSGKQLQHAPHRKLAAFRATRIPDDIDALYEVAIFAADNNALEVRSIERSDWSKIPAVRKAQDAFFEQDVFTNRAIWDRNLFDGNKETGFWPSSKYRVNQKIKKGCLRIDLGKTTDIDELKIKVPNYYSLQPLLEAEGRFAEVSTDLIHWKTITFLGDTTSSIYLNDPVRYIKLDYFPQHIVEIEGYQNQQALNREDWRASNLFAPLSKMKAQKVWKTNFQLNELAKNSYLSIAINGIHGIEGAYVAVKVDGILMGCPDRSPSFPSNSWEYVNARRGVNYTYYFPLTEDMLNKEIEIFVMAYVKGKTDLQPEVWISSYPFPYVAKSVRITR